MSNVSRDKNPRTDMMRMAAGVAAAYVARNSVPTGQIREIIQTVFASLHRVGANGPHARGEPPRLAARIKKSITAEYLVCLEDGKKMKMLKRHLRVTFAMTPEQYRAKWGLPADYPMVAPNYAAQRSAFAKKIGLGRKPAGGGRRAKRDRAAR